MTIPREHAAALVVGAGSLPYTLDRIPGAVVVADRHAGVVRSVAERCVQLQACASWYEYGDRFSVSDHGITELGDALASGLAGSFWEVQDAARKAQIVGFIGDVVGNADAIAAEMRQQRKSFTFINFTNVAEYLQPTHRENGVFLNPGGSVLAYALEKLPVHDSAVICDSQEGMKVKLYTPGEYIGAQTVALEDSYR